MKLLSPSQKGTKDKGHLVQPSEATQFSISELKFDGPVSKWKALSRRVVKLSSTNDFFFSVQANLHLEEIRRLGELNIVFYFEELRASLRFNFASSSLGEPLPSKCAIIWLRVIQPSNKPCLRTMRLHLVMELAKWCSPQSSPRITCRVSLSERS